MLDMTLVTSTISDIQVSNPLIMGFLLSGLIGWFYVAPASLLFVAEFDDGGGDHVGSG